MKLKFSISKAQRRAQEGFTLLELLIVVAILAIIAGGLIVAYDGINRQAAKSQAANTIAGLDQAIRTFTTVTGTAPDNLDSLVSAQFSTPTDATAALFGTDGDAVEETDGTTDGGLPEKLGGKLEVKYIGGSGATAMNAKFVDALTKAGITKLRYADKAEDDVVPGTTPTLGKVKDIDIPNRAFDDKNGTANRGRGFSGAVAAGAAVAVWKPGTTPGFINNTKVGAAPDDVLIAFGLGNNSTIINDNPNLQGNVNLSAVPNYPDVKKNEYNRYILLYNVGSETSPRQKAKLQAVLDTRGDFIDEELAEASGQKL
jgi:prepilin-type N-terminal cleavage/methylation domain-containing protein